MERPEVKEVRFEGVHAVHRSALEDAIATKASGCLGLALTPFCWFTKSPYVYEHRYLDRAELSRDVVRLLVYYYDRGWRDASVDTAVARVGPNAVRVTFTVTERAPTIVKAITVDDPAGRLGGRRRRGRERGQGRLVRPRVGEPLDVARLDSTVVDLRSAYWQRGYGDVQVKRPAIAVDDSADTATVHIAVQRGPLTPIASIDIVHQGARRDVSDETIRNSLFIEPGDLFVRSEVGRSQRALYESGLFRSAVIDTAVAADAVSGRTVCAQQTDVADGTTRTAPRAAAGRPDSAKALVICVVEGPPREVRTSMGVTTADFFQVDARYTHNYWLGGARRFTISGAVGNLGARYLYDTFPFRIGNPYNSGANDLENALRQTDPFFAPTYQVGVDVLQRWFRSPRNTAGIGMFAHRRISPGVFVDVGRGGSMSFTRQVRQDIPISASYQFAVSRVDAGDIYFCVNYGVCDAPTVVALRGKQRLSPLALTGAVNRSNDPLFPTRGGLARFEIEHASAYTASDFRYNRFMLQASNYRRLPFRRSVLALRVRGGWVNGLTGTNAAVGVTGDVEGDILHPSKRFYAGGAQSVRGFGENQLGPKVLTIAPDDIRGRRDSTVGGETIPTYRCAPPTPLETCFALYRDSIPDNRYTPRPLGGTTLVEGNVELRVPVWGPVWAAVFLDGAMLGEGSLRDVTSGASALTPGFGVRYRSPVGPVRVDIGIRPGLVETLPVVTQVDDSLGRRLLELGSDKSCQTTPTQEGCRRYPQEGATGFRGVLNRIMLHLSIGEAF